MRLIKLFLKFFLALLLFFAAVWTIFAMAFQTKVGKQWMVDQGLTLIEKQTGLKIECKAIDLLFPLSFRIQELKVLEQGTTLLTVEEVKRLTLSSRLLMGKIVIPKLSATGIYLHSLPKSSAKKQTSPGSIKLKEIDLKEIQIAKSVSTQLGLQEKESEQLSQLTFQLEGRLQYHPFKAMAKTDLTLTMRHLLYKSLQGKVKVKAEENENVSVKMTLAHLPLNESLTANMNGFMQAPFASWIALAQGEKSAIDGDLHCLIADRGTELQVNFTLVSQKNFKLEFHLQDPLGQLLASANLTDQEITESQLQGKIFLPQQASSSFISMKGSLTGPFQNLQLKLSSFAPKLLIEEKVVTNLLSTVQARFAGQQLTGKAETSFEWETLSPKLFFKFDWNWIKQQVFLKEFSLKEFDAELNGEATIDTTTGLVSGRAQAKQLNLASFSAIAQADLKGSADLLIDFMPLLEENKKSQAIEWGLEAEKISYNDFFLRSFFATSFSDFKESYATLRVDVAGLEHKNYSLEEASLKASCNYRKALTGNYFLTAKQLHAFTAKTDLFKVEGKFDTQEQKWPFELKAAGHLADSQINENWEIETTGNWSTDLTRFLLEVQQLTGSFGKTNVKLEKALHLKVDKNSSVLEPFSLLWGQATMQGAFLKEKEEIDLDFHLKQIPPELFKLAPFELPFQTQASLKVSLQGKLDRPTGSIALLFDQLQFSEDHLLKKAQLQGKIALQLSEKEMKVNSELVGIGKTPLSIHGTLSYILSLSPIAIKKEENSSFQLAIKGEGSADAYLPLFLEEPPGLAGQVEIALQVSGDLKRPLVQGFLELKDGIYEDLETGATYKNLFVRLEGEGEKVVLKEFSTVDSRDGGVKAHGEALLDYGRNFPFHVQLDISHMYVMHSDYASIAASGKLNLSGNSLESKLKGQLQVDRAEVKLEEALPTQIKTIDVTYINAPKGFTDFKEKAAKAATELDIKLSAPLVTIQGNGLKSEWKGEINISGTTKQPLLFGDLHIAQGQYEIKGKTFNLSQGSIHFAGAAEKKTTLYVVASKEMESLKVEIIVKGPLDKLAFSFRSNPPLSQRDILSHILFNKGISDITTGEGDTLNQSFTSLNASEKTEESQDLLTRLRNNIGIDRLDFTTSGEGEDKDFALQVGKYLWEGVFISLNKSIGAAPDRFAIEVKLRENIKAEAEVDIGSNSQGNQGKLSLKWKKDY